jgi:hypothetical protein
MSFRIPGLHLARTSPHVPTLKDRLVSLVRHPDSQLSYQRARFAYMHLLTPTDQTGRQYNLISPFVEGGI